jgi:hypothetical protein
MNKRVGTDIKLAGSHQTLLFLWSDNQSCCISATAKHDLDESSSNVGQQSDGTTHGIPSSCDYACLTIKGIFVLDLSSP